MLELTTLVTSKRISEAIMLFEWMSRNRLARLRAIMPDLVDVQSEGDVQPATLLDDGSSESLLLNADSRYAYARTDVNILCDLGFLVRVREQVKLTEKAERLVDALYVKKIEQAGRTARLLDWIVVTEGELFIYEGETPPNLDALIGGAWTPGDRIVITCHDPEYALVRHLPLALAGTDSIFISDSTETAEDFKYSDAESDAP